MTKTRFLTETGFLSKPQRNTWFFTFSPEPSQSTYHEYGFSQFNGGHKREDSNGRTTNGRSTNGQTHRRTTNFLTKNFRIQTFGLQRRTHWRIRQRQNRTAGWLAAMTCPTDHSSMKHQVKLQWSVGPWHPTAQNNDAILWDGLHTANCSLFHWIVSSRTIYYFLEQLAAGTTGRAG